MPYIDTINDFFNLLSKLTVLKVRNSLEIISSYFHSKITRIPLIKGMPIALSVEPTTSCNLRCPQCPSGLRAFTRPTGMLDPSLFEQVIDQLNAKLIYLTFYFQGEPYLNPKFLDMVKYAVQKKIYTSTSTNGHYLDDENAKKTVLSGLDRLIISIDGATQNTYSKYRIGGDLQKVLQGLSTLLAWKKKFKSNTPYIILQFIVFKHNEHELESLKSMARLLNIKLQIKTAQVYDENDKEEILPNNKKYSRYHNTTKLIDSCWKMWHSCVVTWDGKIVPCCFDKDAKYQLGNINTENFRAVWQGNSYQNFRKSLLISRKEIDICTNCTEGAKVFV